MEQQQEIRNRGGPAQTTLARTNPPRSPQPQSKPDIARANANFIKRENSYSSEEEVDDDEDEDEEDDDSEIERIDLHSKYDCLRQVLINNY